MLITLVNKSAALAAQFTKTCTDSSRKPMTKSQEKGAKLKACAEKF
jgi:hypothetical protein